MDQTRLDDDAIREVIAEFYGRVRRDEVLGPLFDEAVADWPDHLARLGDFWSSIMLMTGRYKGNPVAMHLLYAAQTTPEMFQRWLALWAHTTDELLSETAAAKMQTKASRIARTLQAALAS